MNRRSLNYNFLLVIVGLVITLYGVMDKQPKETIASRDDFFLVHFDQADYDRLEKMVQRFKEGKGDNLMLIPPIIDGGHWIYDVMSDGREIRWFVDNTRDGMSSDRGRTEYVCSAIDITETQEYYTFELSKCNNYDEDEKLNMASFFKDEL